MTRYCPRCTVTLSLDDTICSVCGMVLAAEAVNEIIADEFLAEELIEEFVEELVEEELAEEESFEKGFLDHGAGVTPGAEASRLVADDEILAEEMVHDEIVGDHLSDDVPDELMVQEQAEEKSFAKGFLDHGAGVTPEAETARLGADDEILAEEMISDEITGDHALNGVIDEFLVEERMEEESFAKGFLDHGAGVVPGAEGARLGADDEILAEEMVSDEIVAHGYA